MELEGQEGEVTRDLRGHGNESASYLGFWGKLAWETIGGF